MNQTKYIGMDVHMATTVIAVLNSEGRVVAEAIIETKSSAIVDFLKSQRGTVHVAFEEGTQASWLYDLIRRHVAEVVVCDPRQIAGQKSDKTDAKRVTNPPAEPEAFRLLAPQRGLTATEQNRCSIRASRTFATPAQNDHRIRRRARRTSMERHIPGFVKL